MQMLSFCRSTATLPADWTERSSLQLWAAVVGRAVVKDAAVGVATLALWQFAPSALRVPEILQGSHLGQWFQNHAHPLRTIAHSVGTVLLELGLWEVFARLLAPASQQQRWGGQPARAYLLCQAMCVASPLFIWTTRHWQLPSGAMTEMTISTGMTVDAIRFAVGRVLSAGLWLWRTVVRKTAYMGVRKLVACWAIETTAYSVELARGPLLGAVTPFLPSQLRPEGGGGGAWWPYVWGVAGWPLRWAAEHIDGLLGQPVLAALRPRTKAARARAEEASNARIQDLDARTAMARESLDVVNRHLLGGHPATQEMLLQSMSGEQRACVLKLANSVAYARYVHHGARLAAGRLKWAITLFNDAVQRGVVFPNGFGPDAANKIGKTTVFTDESAAMIPRSTSEMFVASHGGQAEAIDRPELLEEDSSHHCCAVCLEDYADGVLLRQLDCGHAFHDRCIVEWLANRPECPCCRVKAGAKTELDEMLDEELTRRVFNMLAAATVPREIAMVVVGDIIPYARSLEDANAFAEFTLHGLKRWWNVTDQSSTAVGVALQYLDLFPLQAGVDHRAWWA